MGETSRRTADDHGASLPGRTHLGAAPRPGAREPLPPPAGFAVPVRAAGRTPVIHAAVAPPAATSSTGLAVEFETTRCGSTCRASTPTSPGTRTATAGARRRGHGAGVTRAALGTGARQSAAVPPRHRPPIQRTGHGDLSRRPTAAGGWCCWHPAPRLVPRVPRGPGDLPVPGMVRRLARGGSGAGAASGAGRLDARRTATRTGRLHRHGARTALDVPAPQARGLLVADRTARPARPGGPR